MNKYTPEQLDILFEEFKELVDNPEYKLRVIKFRKYIDNIYPREVDVISKDVYEVKRIFVGLHKRVRYIEECLGIDFDLDRIDDCKQIDSRYNIDYNFIKDDFLRDTAKAYYREMLRYDYATRNHIRCFGEFCRLAIIQIEIMLNYFYTVDDNYKLLINKIAQDEFNKELKKWKDRGEKEPKPDETEIKENISKNARNDINDFVSKKDYAIKSSIFIQSYLKKQKIGKDSITSISIWTSNMRNRKSHGSNTSIEPYEKNFVSKEEIQELEKCETQIIEMVQRHNTDKNEKIKFENNRLVTNKWDLMPSDLKDLYNKKYLPLQWVYEKPFESVHEFIRVVARTCAKEIGNNQE